MQAQQAVLTFNEAEKSLGGRLLKIAIEIDRVEGYSEPHAIAIAWTAEKIGTRMGLHGIDLTALKFAALAHDLGERAMKRNYLLRPGELSWEETLDLWRHPILGEQAAGELKLPRQTQLLIRWHHEWWNGGGYPDGLAAEAIPPGARILRAVDSYFALISDRPHRPRFDRAEAEQIIADLAGIEFDPQVAKLLLEVLAEEAVESTFAYLAPGDEAVTRLVEDQPQPIDEVLDEIPAGIMDKAVTERRLDMTGADLASDEANGEFELETSTEIGAADFASPNAIEEAVMEGWTEMTGARLALSETPGEVADAGQMEIVHGGLAEPNASHALDRTEAEDQKGAPAADFTSSKTPGEAWDDGQTGSGGSKNKITQEKQEEIES